MQTWVGSPTVFRLAIVGALFLRIAIATAAEERDFVRDVRPLFEKYCYECHSTDEAKSSFRLDLREAAFAGGELYGPAIEPGNPATSLLMRVLGEGAGETEDVPKMPPDGPGLRREEIEILFDWIAQGAVWPKGVDTAQQLDPQAHWAFQPRVTPPVPIESGDTWSLGPIDRFILRELDRVGLKPRGPASRQAWLRRVTFDLTGLPPTPAEIEAFARDSSATAFERVVERLLSSPRYGERLAQHWFDVVRYADTHGFEVNTERPNAWPYRDYVIDAFNRDTPYDHFVRQQIIGDQTGHDAATGFLITASVLLPGQIGQDEPSKRLARQDALDEIVVNIGQSFLGLSIGCARCHNHKFDPLSQRDYFAMQAFVAGVEYEERLIDDPAAATQWQRLSSQLRDAEQRLAAHVPLSPSATPRPPINPRWNIDRFPPQIADRVRLTILKTNRLEPCIDELQVFDAAGENVALATRGAVPVASGSNTSPDRHELRFVNDGLFGNSRSWMSNEDGGGWVEIRFPTPVEIHRVQWGRDRLRQYDDRLATEYRLEAALGESPLTLLADHSDRQSKESAPPEPPLQASSGDADDANQESFQQSLVRVEELFSQVQSLAGGRPIFAGRFRHPDAIHLLRRGDPEQPQEAVLPEIPKIFGSLGTTAELSEHDRRRALAEWITSPNHPLTARVMANRLWQFHFGTALVETPNDFGRHGSPPTHPELLDWLASELVRNQWSLRPLHRAIVLSATYRQSTEPDPEGLAIDADDRLLWRYPLRRLDGEAIRDAMLQCSNRLSFVMGGPGFNLFHQRGGLSGFTPVETVSAETAKRMIYAHRVRRERDAVFGPFDCPDNGQSTPRRRESTTPIQALNLMNSPLVLMESQHFAQHVSESAGTVPEDQIRLAYAMALGRLPHDDELENLAPIVEQYGLRTLCRALLNCNEFVYLP